MAEARTTDAPREIQSVAAQPMRIPTRTSPIQPRIGKRLIERPAHAFWQSLRIRYFGASRVYNKRRFLHFLRELVDAHEATYETAIISQSDTSRRIGPA